MPRSVLKCLVPNPVKEAVKRAMRAHQFRRAIRRLAALTPGEIPDRRTLAKLHLGWGNEAFSAPLDYLEEVARHAAATAGPVLECGSGLTTVLLGFLASRRGVDVWTLEQHPDWHAKVTQVIEECALAGVHLCLSPLMDYGGFSWYQAPLEAMPREFCLVICDGPPGETTPGGRYGLWPVVGERLGRDAIILLDDADRPSESAVLQRWRDEAGVRVTLSSTPGGTYATITRS